MFRTLWALILAASALLPGGARAVTLPVLGVTVDAVDVTSQVMAASWNLGISDFLAELSPNTASLSFKGQITAVPSDAVVISAGGTAMWTGRVDSLVETRDVNGDYWTSLTATDSIGALGAATLEQYELSGVSVTLQDEIENISTAAGVSLAAYDMSLSGLAIPTYSYLDPFDGPALEYIKRLADFSNAMVALQHDGTIHIVVREALDTNLVDNGTFDTDTSGWSNVSGGAISRVTASPYAGAGNARIVSSATQYSGADYAITGVFRPGDTYRLTYYARTISGSAVIRAGLGDSGDSDTNTATPTLTGSWVAYTVDWSPTAVRDGASVMMHNNAASTNTFEIDSVSVTRIVNATDVSGSITSWEKSTSIETDINKWRGRTLGGGGEYYRAIIGSDAGDIAIYGERVFDGSDFVISGYPQFDDWIALGGSQRPVVSRGELVVKDSTSAILALDPLDWIDDGTDEWQVMSMSWSASPGEPWRVTVTADNLLALL